MTDQSTYTAFDGHRQIAAGTAVAVATSLKKRQADAAAVNVLVFDDRTGREVDFDLRGTADEVAARLRPTNVPDTSTAGPRGPGRPRLGVVAREVTLLPRHWEWLASQPGGASVTLRRLVEQARRASAFDDVRRNCQERAYRFMSAIAGNLPGFEEASRAVFSDDRAKLAEIVSLWPADVAAHVTRLASSSDMEEAGH
ncbi:MAG: DUF2239 family protein [Hyphomicrobiaceae bacterium]